MWAQGCSAGFSICTPGASVGSGEKNPSCCNQSLPVWFVSLQLARHNKELQAMLKPGGTYGEGDEALEFYAKHTAQIEVRAYVTASRPQILFLALFFSFLFL